jgi:hypothetical protein
MGATNMRVPGRNIYMSVHGGVSTHNFVYTNIFVCRFSRIQYPKNQPIDASWHDSCHIASGPCIVVPAYLFIQACSFLRLFRHNFAENGPQDLRENGLKRRVKQFYTICDKNQLINTNIGKVTVRDRLLPMSSNFGQHPPFFSKMRTFFKNRLAWLHFYSNLWCNHVSRFLSCIFKKKVFFPVGILSQIGTCR